MQPLPNLSSIAARRALAIAVTAVLAAHQGEALAQSASAQTNSLQEVVVTATRHEESLSKVAVSVSAITQDSMDQKGIKDVTDIVRYTPGVSIDQTGTNNISIRGISSSGGAGTTGIYIDDTPIQMRSLGFNPDDTLPKTFDLDRVEVLRGPQGTLFGSGSEGGTVRYILTQPSLSKASTYARGEVSYTRYGDPSVEGGIAHGAPLVDGTVGYRASVWYRHDGGWIDRVDPTTGATVDSKANRADAITARLAFIIAPNDAVTITPSIFYQNNRKHDVSTYWEAYSDTSSGRFHNANPDRTPVPDEFYLPALKIDADLGKMRFVSNSSYYNRKEVTGYEGTNYDLSFYQGLGWPDAFNHGSTYIPVQFKNGAIYPLLDNKGVHLPPGATNYRSPNTIKNNQESMTQEFRLESTDPTSRFTWTAGAFWQLTREYSLEEIHDPNQDQFLQAIFSPINPGDVVNSLNMFGEATLPNGDNYYNRNIAHDRQIAGFGEVSYKLTDEWKVILGGRYSKSSFNLSHFADGPLNYGQSTYPDPKDPTNLIPGTVLSGATENKFTPKAGVAWQATSTDLYYFTYAQGYRAGGSNAPLPPFCHDGLNAAGYPKGAPGTYKSDTTQSFEVGAKNNLSNKFRLASSVYYIKWQDIQQSVYISGGCGLQFTDNLGTAVAKGFDVQADMILGSFNIEAALGYTDARFSKDSKNSLALKGDAISGQAAINGAPGVNPPWTASVGAQYNFTLSERDAFARLDYQYTRGSSWLAPVQDPNSAQYTANAGVNISPSISSSKFMQARAGLTLGDWQASLFIDNLLNAHPITNYERTFTDAYNPANATNSVPLPQYNQYTFRPMTVGLSVSYRH